MCEVYIAIVYVASLVCEPEMDVLVREDYRDGQQQHESIEKMEKKYLSTAIPSQYCHRILQKESYETP